MSTDLLDVDTMILDSLSSTEEETTPIPGENEEGNEEGKEEESGGEEDDGKKPDSESGEDEEGEDGGQKPADQPKPKVNKIQQRFDDLTREIYRLRRENEEYRGKFEEREPELPPQPNPNDFVDGKGGFDQRKYDFAMGQWQQQMATAQQQQEGKAEAKRSREMQQYNLSIERDKSKFEDFDIVVGRLSREPLPKESEDVLHEVLCTVNNQAELLHHLGKNIDLFRKIVYDSPRKCLANLMKVSNLLEEKGKPKQKVSNAPPPAKKVGGSAKQQKDVKKMTAAEYMKHLEKK